MIARRTLSGILPPLRRADERLEHARASLVAAETTVARMIAESNRRRNEPPGAPTALYIEITRGSRVCSVDPAVFDLLDLRTGDLLRVLPEVAASGLPHIWEDIHVPVSAGHAIRVPPKWETFAFKGFDVPVHLIKLTGAGPETLDSIGKAHIEHYKRVVGLEPGMTILDVGCGIGRVAFQLIDYLDTNGRYIGMDIIQDSIAWCKDNIESTQPNFSFHHFDAQSELYNPFGTMTSMDVQLPSSDASVDRIVLASVFTHMLEDEVAHYLSEFRRVLKPGGLIYASFFLYSDDAIEAAQTCGNTAWKATFAHDYGGGVYGNDPSYPRGAVAFTDAAMRRLMERAGLVITRPYVKGW
jgi:SAM-dependent methyltransferase